MGSLPESRIPGQSMNKHRAAARESCTWAINESTVGRNGKAVRADGYERGGGGGDGELAVITHGLRNYSGPLTLSPARRTVGGTKKLTSVVGGPARTRQPAGEGRSELTPPQKHNDMSAIPNLRNFSWWPT